MFLAAGLAVTLGACDQDEGLRSGRAYQPIPEQTLSLMDKIGTTKFSPVLLRAFKKESELEVWKMKADGTYALLKTYPMCRWSGQLGPKRREGDRQVPEGFYHITQRHLNPNSAYYLSFNVGYPNAFDRANKRTGSLIMVHGACSSRGCFSMTDEQIAEIYAVVREAFSGGQKAIQMQSLPFRMTPNNLAKHRLDKDYSFWKNLKEGSDSFEVSKLEPKVMVCNRKYVFNSEPANATSRVTAASACPPLNRNENLIAAVQHKHNSDMSKVAALVKKGVRPVKIVYADGGQHQSFKHVLEVSRPGALAKGPVEIALDDHGRPMKAKPAAKTMVATAKPEHDKGKAAGTAVAGRGVNAAATKVANTSASAKAKTLASAPAKATPAAGAGALANSQVTTLPATASAYTQPGVQPKPAQSQPFLSRWFGGGKKQEPAPPPPAVAAPAAAATAAPSAPLPPRRTSGARASAGGKPDKRASALPALIQGSQPAVPQGLTAYAPLR
ncbi:MAG: L,D-transpeptidase family protein [Beijerinckiaceae bacterium]